MSSISLNEQELQQIKEFYSLRLFEAQAKAQELKITLQKIEAAFPSAKSLKKIRVTVEPNKRGRKAKVSIVTPKQKTGRKPKGRIVPEPVVEEQPMEVKAVPKAVKNEKKNGISKAGKSVRKPHSDIGTLPRRIAKRYERGPNVAPTINEDYVNSLLNNKVEESKEPLDVIPVIATQGQE